MTQETHEQENVLEQVQKGMHVYDRDGKDIGKVEYVQFGDEDPTEHGVETVTVQRPPVSGGELLDKVLEGARPRDRMPEEFRSRLMRYGFLKVNPGILRSDRYVVADQIAGMSGSRVKLNVLRDELITL
jgi:hypothetical protein